MNISDTLRVGVIATTHGVRGEVKVYPTTDEPTRFDTLKHVYIDDKKKKIELEITQVKYFKNMVIVKFKGYDSIDDILPFKGCDLLIDRADGVPLGENENYIADLLGLTVKTDEGWELGILTDVLETGANDVYVITGEDKIERLVPAIPQCILDVDLESGIMLIHVLPGLFE